jgi:hypothetical protein
MISSPDSPVRGMPPEHSHVCFRQLRTHSLRRGLKVARFALSLPLALPFAGHAARQGIACRWSYLEGEPETPGAITARAGSESGIITAWKTRGRSRRRAPLARAVCVLPQSAGSQRCARCDGSGWVKGSGYRPPPPKGKPEDA